MTTWYTAPWPYGEQPVWPFTVRPDIWPPGSVVNVVNTDVGWLANWDPWTAKTRPGPESRDRPMTEYSAPGAAEALILAGRVAVNPPWDRTKDLLWTEVPAP